jgi:hypothetical protein
MTDVLPTQLIRLILLDGDPEGLRSVAVAGRTTILMGCPWSHLQKLLGRPEANRPAVYFLMGTPFEGEKALSEVVYIGECDSLAGRFKQHHMQDVADWGQIFVATTTESTFNKAHARLAEHLLVERAKTARRMEVLTKSTSRGTIDEGDEAFTKEFVENVVTLTQTLGVLLFRPFLKIPSQKNFIPATNIESSVIADAQNLPKFRFDYTKEKIPAEMITDGKDFVVLKGSKARADSAGISLAIKQMRDQARLDNILIKDLNSSLEVFQKDFPTTSVSAAGSMVYGSACSGPIAWRHIGTDKLYKDWVAEGS